MEEFVDTKLISPYDDYGQDDIYVKEQKNKYGLSEFFIGELVFNPKDFSGLVYRIKISKSQEYKTVLSCFHKTAKDTYFCLFNGKTYSKENINNLSEMRNFIPLYTTNVNLNLTFDEAIKIFDFILGGNKKFKISDDIYNIENFYYGNLKLQICSKQSDKVDFNNIINHIILISSKCKYNTTLEQQGSTLNFYNIYKVIFYAESKNSYKAYCINDGNTYINISDLSKDRVISNLVSLKDVLAELKIENNESFVKVKNVLMYQKKLDKKH